MTTLATGTRVKDQYDGKHEGTVEGPVPGLPGFVYVHWDTADCHGSRTEEQVEDVTVVLAAPESFLADLFRDEYCAECGGDAIHHTAVPFMGNWFARCDYPPAEDGTRHPTVAAFREAEGTA